MSKIKYTKGRWVAVGVMIEHDSMTKADIASFDPDEFEQGSFDRSYEEICANARLCAQAPAMLEMLKMLSNQMRGVRILETARSEIESLIKAAQ